MAQRVSRGWGRTKPPPGTGIDWGHDLGHGLIGAWPLNEAGGKRARDVARNNLGTCNGSWSRGPIGNAPLFASASSQYVGLNETVDRLVIPTTGSVSMWWRSTVSLTGINHYVFVVQSGGTYWMIACASDGNIYTGWYGGADDRATCSQASAGITGGNWYHLCVTWRNGGNTNFYVNGVLRATKVGLTSTWDTTGFPVYIARLAGSFADMQADNIRIYNKVLTAAQAQRLYSDPWAGYYRPRRKIIQQVAIPPRKLLCWAADGRPEELSDVEATAYLVSLGH